MTKDRVNGVVLSVLEDFDFFARLNHQLENYHWPLGA